MAGIVVTVNSVNITAYTDVNSIVVEEIGTALVATCQFNVQDHSGTVSIATKHVVDIDDDGTTLFGGEVVEITEGQQGLTKTWCVICQDYSILLEEHVVVAETYAAGTSDQAIINDLLTDYRSDITNSNVAEIDSSMEELAFVGMTVRECLDDICKRTGGRYYVDYDKDLHYFSTEANPASFSLSTSPNMSTSFPFGGFQRTRSAAQLCEYVYVLGQGDSGSDWHPSAPSYTASEHHAASRDMRITTAQGVTDRGTQIIDRYGSERVTYELWTERDGLRAGQSITVVNEIWSIDASFYIRKVKMEVLGKDGEKRRYHLSLNDEGIEPAKVARQRAAMIIGQAEITVNNTMPVAARGWSHDMVFSATDWNTVAWAVGTITLAGGVTTYSIDAGNTGNISNVTYIYLDTAVSVTVLQTTTTAATAIGMNKILIGVAAVGDETEPVNAAFTAFGGGDTDDLGIFIHGNNLAANSITANEIAANTITAAEVLAATITAAEIAALTITGAKIAAGTLTADKMAIGEMLFNEADGLLLLGPFCDIAPTAWYSPRRQKATISGAFHQEAGRWAGMRGLVIEEGTTNCIINPSFETGVAGWAPVSCTFAQDTATGIMFGDASGKAVSDAANDRVQADVTANTAAGTEYTFSVYLTGTIGIHLCFWDDVTGTQSSSAYTLKNQATRYQLTRTFGVGSTSRVVWIDVTGAGTIYIDGAQLEAKGNSTTYCDGSLGTGYSWSGTAHASTSTRTQTEVQMDSHVALANNNATQSHRIVLQMPYDADATWPETICRTWFLYQGATLYLGLIYRSDLDKWQLANVTGGTIDSWSATQTFKAGDWLDIVCTLDYTGNQYLYVNGTEVDHDGISGLTTPTSFVTWNLGGWVDGGANVGFVVGEYSVFDRALTAAEVAQLYNLQRPLVDAGAQDLPGIYITDGRFRIASSTTGNRIDITADEIAGYDSGGTKQFYLRASDGVAVCGAGAVTLDANGVSIACGTGASNWIGWVSGGTTRASMYASYVSNQSRVYFYSGPAGSGGHAEMTFECQDSGGAGTGVRLRMSSVGADGYLTVHIVGNEDFRITTNGIRTSDRVEFGGAINYLYESGGNVWWHNAGGDTQLN